MLYDILLWFHILVIVVAFGANLTYILWFFRSDKNSESLLFTLHTVKIMDDRMANPSYVLAFFTGAGMIYIKGLSYLTPWILTALILYVIVSVLGLAIYSPWLKKQIALAEGVGPDSAEYKVTANRVNTLGLALNLLVLTITFLMVVKPELW
jgi:uncharacterized membrane protein